MLRPILISTISLIILFTGCEESPTAADSTSTVFKTFGGDYDDIGSAVLQTPDGGYLVVGTSFSGSVDTPTLSDLFVIQTNSEGDTVATKVFNTVLTGTNASEITSFDLISDVKLLDDGGYILVGSKFDSTTNYDVWLIKLDASLNVVFSEKFDGPGTANGNDFGFSVNVCDDNGFIISGKTFNTDSGFDMWVIKTDSGGNLPAGDNTTAGGFGDTGTPGYYVNTTPLMNDAANYVVQTSSGEYVVVGEIRTDNDNNDMIILKLSSKGVLMSSAPDPGTFNTDGFNTFGGGLDESAKFVQETSDGGFILVGNSYSNGSGQSDIYIVKSDSDGSKVWDSYVGSSRNDFANAVQQTSDGGFVIVGNTFGDSSNIMVVKILPNTQGEIDWQYSMDGGYDDVGYHISQTSDGGFIVTGSTYSATKMNEVILIKLDASGSQEF